jgi:predicted Zn-dependent protease
VAVYFILNSDKGLIKSRLAANSGYAQSGRKAEKMDNTENVILECVHELISLYKLAGAGDSRIAIQQSAAIRNALDLLPDYCDDCGTKLTKDCDSLYCVNCYGR